MEKVYLTRVLRAGIKHQVFEQLRDRIIDRTWPPGTKIPSENALADLLGVSRVSIREALHMLVSLGLLDTRHGGGTYVRKYTGEILLNPLLPMLVLDKMTLLQVLEYRNIVEKGIVSLAVKRARRAEIEELEGTYKAMKEHRNDSRLFAEADLNFHLLLAKATGNPIVIKVTSVIMDILKTSMYRIVETLGVRDGLYYHRRILDAIKRREGPLAEALMEEHVARTVRRVRLKRLGNSGSKPKESQMERGSKGARENGAPRIENRRHPLLVHGPPIRSPMKERLRKPA